MSATQPSRGRWDSGYHAPALAVEVLNLLAGKRRVLDGTLGGGGHSLALLEGGASRVTGVDRDPEAIAEASARLASFGSEGRFRAINANYSELDDVRELDGETFDGILLDLGISSRQVDSTGRGFSFREGARLDMRMSPDGESAADLLNGSDERELYRIFREYGDEPRAARLAREVVRRRGNRAFASSDDFVGAIRGALGPRTGPGDFARLFQAVRIAVNDELPGLDRALPALRDRLAPGGVLAVISYHSGEDRLVKRAFRDWSADCLCPPRQPICTCRGRALGRTLTRRAMVPSEDEMERNPRARSARLRAWEAA
jgi:16S rRNA (cytosine1402-N4)-methyltransferase